MKIVIDRFEGEYAVCEDENIVMHNISRTLIPSESREMDVLEIILNKEETEKIRKYIEELAKDMWK